MTHLSPKTARHLLTAMTTGHILSRSRNMGLEALVERSHAISTPLLNHAGIRIAQHLVYSITEAGRAWLRPAAPTIIRDSTKSEPAPASIVLSDPRQMDIEAAIAASSGGAAHSTPLTVFDAPTDTATGVSAPVGRSSTSALAAAKPEQLSS
ncbi:hypothetical protein [Sphingomonas sp. CFBP 8760]|uniref:hypothetical protein n=1 Tax=Sphingomonas sp. CFBP 8760 TaxID=2775282 RepID=UPI00177AF44C|nr:hypothetical protein [Sphingomonas sp. CFBP 8760]MBD8548036.1 hypothetical protein [Sphingomonas sp. CFBP 8760]